MKSVSGWEKYRELVIAIGLFIVLDLGILIFNIVASTQLDTDANRINQVGELRMLTQQITKSLLTLQVEQGAELPMQTSLTQLSQGMAGFEHALAGLQRSLARTEWLSQLGQQRNLGDEQRLLLAKLEREWRPLAHSIQPVLDQLMPSKENVDMAVTKAVARNVRLVGLANDLAQGVEAAAGGKTLLMRQIQMLAIGLATLNFLFIVFKFVRRLRVSDQRAAAAQQEIDDILATVGEGLLLVRSDRCLGGQFSASVAGLFMRPVSQGLAFLPLLHELLGSERAQEAETYIDLLFDPKVKPALLKQLDPLREVRVIPPPNSVVQERYLTFQVTPVRQGKMVKELLLTVFDVTPKVVLERQLAASQETAKSDVEDLIQALEQEPVLMRDFLLGSRSRLVELNRQFKDVGSQSGAYRALLGDLLRVVHGIKGEGAALGLSAVARQAHGLETAVAPLMSKAKLTGDDLIGVVFELSRVQDQIDRVQRMFERIGRAGTQGADDAVVWMHGTVSSLRQLAEQVAQAEQKEVSLLVDWRELSLPEILRATLREVLPQLVRNAVVHGIEPPHERELLGKSRTGELRLEVKRTAGGGVDVALTDDGRGVNLPAVRSKVAEWRPDADALNDKALIAHLFEPQFTTARAVTMHAGRGIGLALVKQVVEQAGARVSVLTKPLRSTRFVVCFEAVV